MVRWGGIGFGLFYQPDAGGCGRAFELTGTVSGLGETKRPINCASEIAPLEGQGSSGKNPGRETYPTPMEA